LSPDDQLGIRRRVLTELGGSATAVERVLAHTENHFDVGRVPGPPVFPMPDECHVADWRGYAAACGSDVLAFLRERLVQLRVPVRPGVSGTAEYADVVRRGRPFAAEAFGGQLALERPGDLLLSVQEHPAGALPVLMTRHRPDFVTLDRALAFRSEPVEVGPAVNAHLISGLANWDRLRRYREAWLAEHGAADGEAWMREMRRVIAAEPVRFYDRLMLICVHPYSAVSPRQLGLDMDEATWLDSSTVLRLEHEFTHYALMRLYGRLGQSLLEEMICDWAGITAALGQFEARWFLTFLGLEAWPTVRPDGRMHTYRGGVDGDAFLLLCAVTVRAARGLEAISRKYPRPEDRLRILVALTRLTPELLACQEREDVFASAYAEANRLVGRCDDLQ